MDDSDLKPLSRVATDKTGQEVVVRTILLRDLTQEDLERMVELLQVVFDGWPAFDPGVTAVDHLRWKIETPFAGVAAIAAEIEGELVGSVTVFTLRAKVGDREFPRTRSLDYAVHPDFRGRGIASAISPVIQDAVPSPRLRISETHSQELLHLLHKSGAQVVANPVRPLRCQLGMPDTKTRETTSGLLMALGTAAMGLGNRLRYRRRHSSTPRPKTLTRFDERFDVFWESVREQFDVILVRTHDYLNWRYCDPRGGESIVRVVENQDRVLGYAVLKMQGAEAAFADVLVLPERLDVVDALIADGLEILREDGVKSVICWLPERHPYRHTLLGRSFVQARQRVLLTTRPGYLPDDADAILNRPELRFHYSLGDSDWV